METSFMRDILTVLGISLLVQVLWSILELNLVGEVVVSDVDTIVGAVLSFSLFGNLKYREKVKDLERKIRDDWDIWN